MHLCRIKHLFAPRWGFVLFFAILYGATGFYQGYPGDPIQYIQLSFVPEQWHKIAIHFGYYAIIYAFSFWTGSFKLALIMQTLISVAAACAGLWAFYLVVEDAWPCKESAWGSREVAGLFSLCLGLCGGYWFYAIMGEVYILQNSFLLISFCLFYFSRYFLGAAAFFLACTITPLSGLVMLPMFYLFIRGLKNAPSATILKRIGCYLFWSAILLSCYYYFRMLPGIHYNPLSGSGMAQLGHTLPSVPIPWAEGLRNLAKMHIRFSPVLLPFSAIGVIYCFKKKLRIIHALSLALVVPNLFLIRYLADGSEHTSVWTIVVALYAGVGLLTSASWCERRFSICRWWLVTGMLLLQLFGAVELLIIPQHAAADTYCDLGKVMHAMDTETPDTLWLCTCDSFGARLASGFSRPGRVPGDMGQVGYGFADNVKNFPRTDIQAHAVHEKLARGGQVFIIHENKRWLGPLLSRMLKQDVAPPPDIRIRGNVVMSCSTLIRQVGLLGIYAAEPASGGS